MLVVLEGLDGAGKSTQVKKLRNYLESLYGSLEYIHFPRYDAPVYGNLISRFLRGDFGDNQTVHPQLVALLFAEDRHGAAPAMKDILNNGGTVLLDRYVYSNIAYQCAKISDENEAQVLRDWIFNTEYGNFSLPVPATSSWMFPSLSWSRSSRVREEERTAIILKERRIYMRLISNFRSVSEASIARSVSSTRNS